MKKKKEANKQTTRSIDEKRRHELYKLGNLRIVRARTRRRERKFIDFTLKDTTSHSQALLL